MKNLDIMSQSKGGFMIKRDVQSYGFNPIPMNQRYPEIMKVLQESTEPLSSTEIANLYITNPNSSDGLVTGSILNVLALAGIVKKNTYVKGNSKRNSYELVRK